MKKTNLMLFLKYGRIVIGTSLYAIGFQYFSYPNGIVTGGLTGIAMILNYLTGFPVGLVSILMNIPLFIIAAKRFGRVFFVSSLIGMLLNSMTIDLFALLPFEVTRQPLLGAIYGGIIMGFGLGVVYSAGATTGGMDIVVKLLRTRYQNFNFGTLMLMPDAVNIVVFALVFAEYESAMYAVICLYICTKVVDLVLYGAVNSKVCYIITDSSDGMKDAVMENLHRGVTFLHGAGGWSGQEKKILLCVIKSRQIVELRKIINDIDPKAFLIISDSREVFGEGFTPIGDTD